MWPSVTVASCLLLAGAATAQPPIPPPRPEARALSKLVSEGEGTIPFSIRETVRDADDILGVNWPEVSGGQHSTTLYSFGMSHLSPERFMTLIRFKPELVLLVEGSLWDSPPSVEMGVSYPIREGSDALTLEVAEITPGYFTLVDDWRWIDGSVTYGAFEDSSGELWLFEECVGEYFVALSTFTGMHNEQMVEVTHNAIQAAITAYIEDDTSSDAASENGPCPSESRSDHEIGVNRWVDTGIKVERGDQVTLRASGLVTLGIFAGQGGPEGIQFNPNYSYFPDSPHGCLIGRVRTSSDEDSDPWAYVGSGDVWRIEDPGTVELDLNDNDPSNNTGEFQVEISVCRAH